MTDLSLRLASLRTALIKARLDTVLLSGGADLLFITGYGAMPLERITLLVLTEDNEALLFVPALEAPRVAPGPFEVVAWGETEDPLDLIAEACGDARRIAISDQTWSSFLLGLQARLPAARFESATPLIRPLRERKSSEEIALLAAAGASLDRVAGRIPSLTFAGRSERAVSRDVVDLMVDEGHDLAQFSIVASGPNGASPHHEPGERVITTGDVVVIDFGGKLADYSSDCTRTFVVGEPTEEPRLVHQTVLDAQKAAFEAVRPGVTAESIDAAARQVIEKAGFGEFFIHRTGHGIGLETHEHPYLVAGNDEPLEVGMCFSIEPGIYLPGRFGVRIEDIVTVTETGARSLNDSDRALLTVA